MTVLHGWSPMFGAPGPSPFVIKCDMQLQMLGVRFSRSTDDIQSRPRHRPPYVEDEGRIIDNSCFIRLYFEQKLGNDLDQGLTLAERGAAAGIERLVEDRLCMTLAHERWLAEANFSNGPRLSGPDRSEPEHVALCKQVRAQLHSVMVRHGVGRRTREERMLLAERDISAVAAVLGDKPFLFGDAPPAVDASASRAPISCARPCFDTPLSVLVREHPNLLAYLQRIEELYCADGVAGHGGVNAGGDAAVGRVSLRRRRRKAPLFRRAPLPVTRTLASVAPSVRNKTRAGGRHGARRIGHWWHTRDRQGDFRQAGG